MSRFAFASLLPLLAAAASAEEAPTKPRTAADVLAASTREDWRTLDPENTIYLEIASGRVVIELAPEFAPKHVANIRALARENFFDGLAILRSQDNFVVQWGDPEENPAKKRVPRKAQRTLPAEFTRPAAGLSFVSLPDPDTYAPEVGFVGGFPAARDSKAGTAWLAHCYGMVGAGRDEPADSGGGTELYVVTGHAPRQLDRNITLVGRIVHGIELLSILPRGTAALGFYEKPGQRVPIQRVRVAADVPAAERTPLELLRTDTRTFADLVEARRNRRDTWYKVPAGRIDLCNVLLPARKPPS